MPGNSRQELDPRNEALPEQCRQATDNGQYFHKVHRRPHLSTSVAPGGGTNSAALRLDRAPISPI